jgi:hypothetical protein
MTATTPSTALATIQPAFTDAERLALAGFLAGYRGLTREAYTLDLRQFTGWCRARSLPLFSVRRSDIETFARELEAKGRAAPPSPGGYVPSPGSTSTPSKKSSSSTRPPRTSAVPGWTTSRTPPPWTATNSAPSWSPPDSARPSSTPSSRCSRSTDCACRRPLARTSST